MELRGVADLFSQWDTVCMVASADGPEGFPVLVFDTGLVGGQRTRVLAREIHEEGLVTERYVLAPLDGWVAYEVPLDEPGWHLAVLFVRDENEQLVLAELKVFPGRHRSKITPKAKWVGSVTETSFEHLASIGWHLAGHWSGDITTENCKGITARMLRSTLQLGAVQQRVASLVFTAAKVTFDMAPEFGLLDVDMASGYGSSDANYALWAARYVEALSRGVKSPNKDVAERYGLTHEQVRDRVHIAREKGLLTGGGRGRQGGQLTDKARQLLAELEAAPKTKKKKPTTKKGTKS